MSMYIFAFYETPKKGGKNMKRISYSFGIKVLIFFFFLAKIDAQTTWCERIGDSGNDYAYSIIQTLDDSYAITGASYSFSFGAGYYDVYVIKLNADGIIEWIRAIGGSQNDWSYSIIQTSDSGYAAVGYTSSFGAGGYDVYVVKLKPDGTIGWTKTIGGSSDEEGYSIIQTSDGGYAISGKTKSFSVGSWDVYVIKLDSTGTVQWTRTIGGIDTDVGTSIIQTSDSGYVVAGYTCSFGVGGCDVYVIKLFSTGTIQWIKTIGGSNDDIGYSIIQTSDGGYAIVGKTWSFGTSGADIYVIKLNSTGTVQWTKTIKGSQDDIGSSITQTSYSEYAIAGWTYSFGASEVDIFVIKLDTNFNTCSACSIQIVNSGASSPNSQVSSPAPLTNNVNSSVSSGGNEDCPIIHGDGIILI